MATPAPPWAKHRSDIVASNQHASWGLCVLSNPDGKEVQAHARMVCTRMPLTDPLPDDEPELASSALILLTTDVRSPKVADLALQPQASLTYYSPATQEQLRLEGLVEVIHPSHHASNEAANRQRRTAFDHAPPELRASFLRAAPGTVLDKLEQARWPAILPSRDETASAPQEVRDLVERAFDNMALLLFRVVQADYSHMKWTPHERILWSWSEQTGVWNEVELVP